MVGVWYLTKKKKEVTQVKGGWISLKIHDDFDGRNNMNGIQQNDVLSDSITTNPALSTNFKSNKTDLMAIQAPVFLNR